jgi:hypothetical protein
LAARARLVVTLLVLALLALVAVSAVSDTIKQPDKLIILSTTDVKGKTSPCG